MKMKQIGQSILNHIFLSYLKLLKQTVSIQWVENSISGGTQVFGFWHEDSLFMNVVLSRLSEQTGPVDVIVTADTRGNYIENMIKKSGGSALRVKDGMSGFGALKKIMQNSYETTRSLAVALDGPLGPRHEPKKLAFYIAEQAREDFVGVSMTYSSKLRLSRRWDKYVIPLPFSTIHVAVHNYGEVNKDCIPELPIHANMLQCGILVREMS